MCLTTAVPRGAARIPLERTITVDFLSAREYAIAPYTFGGSVAELLACWTQAQ